MAEAVAIGVLRSLQSLMQEEITGLWNLKSELAELEHSLERVKSVLEESESANNWSCELKNLCYDAEDLLDELTTQSMIRKRDLKNGNLAFEKVRSFFSDRFSLGRKHCAEIKRITSSIDVVLRNLDCCSKNKGEGQIVKSPVKSKGVFVSGELVVGRDSDKMSVIELLCKDSPAEPAVSVVSVVGIGGLGKTALARVVYDDQSVAQRFRVRMWATVSDVFDAGSVLSQLLHSAGIATAEGSTVDELGRKLHHSLVGKDYLVVLDDVWSESSEDWRLLRDLLPAVPNGGGRCLVTTRSTVAARSVGDGPIYHLQGLSESDSWKLFQMFAFAQGKDAIDTDPSLVDIGKTIVSRCAGLPLALKVIGSLLHGHGISKWFSFKENAAFANPSPVHGIMTVLKTSYDQLSPSLKQCFSYCALFPKGYRLKKELLINLWMAEGLVPPANDRAPEDIAEDYFTALVQRSFFQDIKTDSLGVILSCKMHDLLHDLALSIVGSETLIASPFSSTSGDRTRHLSVVGVKDDVFLRTCLPHLKNIRTYLDFSLPTMIQPEIISHARRLRVIDVHGATLSSLPDTLGQLLHLRYLGLSGNSHLELLPNSLTKLYNLQTLKLSGCQSLKELPRDFQKLRNLRHLIIDGCDSLSHMPPRFSTLTCLRTLTTFMVSQSSYASVPDQLEVLKSLSNVEGSLIIKLQLGSSFDGMKTRDAEYLKSMIYLKDLSLQWGNREALHLETHGDHKALFEGLKPHCNLKLLKVEGFPGVELPSWVVASANLVNIQLENCPGLHKLPQFSQLPHLKGLVLHKLENLEYMESDCYVASDPRSTTTKSTTFFPSLEKLTLRYLPKLKGWWREVWKGQGVKPCHYLGNGSLDMPLLPSFPRLCQLRIMECPKLISVPPCRQVEELNLYRFNEALDLILSSNSEQKQCSLVRRVTLDNVEYINHLPLEFHQCISHIVIHLSDRERLSSGKEVFTDTMCSLQSLQITLCSRLKRLSGIGWKHLASLKWLQLSNLPVLDVTSKSRNGEEDLVPWNLLHSLHYLELDFLPKLVDLPEGIQHLPSLETLEIRSCHNLKALPEWIGLLDNLQSLRLEACTGLECLPESISDLFSLRNLEILRCSRILWERCQQPDGEDWPKIMHIPVISIL